MSNCIIVAKSVLPELCWLWDLVVVVGEVVKLGLARGSGRKKYADSLGTIIIAPDDKHCQAVRRIRNSLQLSVCR